MNNTYGTKFIISLVAFVALIGGVFAYVAKTGSSQPAVTTPVTTPTPVDNPVATTPSDVPVTAPTTGKYKDGTYSAVGSYRSPGGEDNLNVSLTLKNGIITDATVTAAAHDGMSSRYQAMFIGGYKAVVVGQPIDTLTVGKVSGSSLTAGGFNDALAQIKTQAQA